MTTDAVTVLSDDRGTIRFAQGLPGFEQCREFVLMTSPTLEPFACLKGVGTDAPAFLTIDPRKVQADYHRALGPADTARIAATERTALVWLALVHPREAGATVNLRAPIVINPDTMRGLQIVDADPTYALDHPLVGM
jgi:flagellar assembly factor FliW